MIQIMTLTFISLLTPALSMAAETPQEVEGSGYCSEVLEEDFQKTPWDDLNDEFTLKYPELSPRHILKERSYGNITLVDQRERRVAFLTYELKRDVFEIVTVQYQPGRLAQATEFTQWMLVHLLQKKPQIRRLMVIFDDYIAPGSSAVTTSDTALMKETPLFQALMELEFKHVGADSFTNSQGYQSFEFE